MDFSAPSPSESTSGSSSVFDSSDTFDLSLILQEDMIQDSPVTADWSALSSMWQDFPELGSMDFGGAPMAVDPSMLNKPLEPDMLSKPHYEYDFPFSFQNQGESLECLSSSDAKSLSRRLSMSSGSGSVSSSESYVDQAAELAKRVRESAGMVTAMPTNSAPSLSTSSASSAASTPPPTTPPSHPAQMAQPTFQASSVPPAPLNSGTMLMSARPKTSHTTIERRYRTNLNARIQSLRMAVPALRVLEWNDGSKKSKGTKAKIKAAEGTDVINERGFVDGVRVARKCSKANVLGKAVEYITALKKRENRLRKEQDGLKALVSGLVGGPALLSAWEKEWQDKFGGEEMDEVDGIEEAGDSDEEEIDEEEERKRKKPRTAPPPPPAASAPAIPGMVAEKRKRGRPRKVVPPPVVAESDLPAPAPSLPVPQSQGPQYLLATFALFSFFNNPLTSSHNSSSSSHEGVVLNAKPHHIPSTYQSFIQAFHLLVSVLVFTSIVLPWASKLMSRTKSNAYRLVKRSSTPTPKVKRTSSLSSALQTSNRGQPGEVEKLKSALGCGRKGDSFEEKGLEQRAWVRLGEIGVFKSDQTSLLSRLYTIYHLRAHLPWFSASAGDLSTLAMLLSPVAKGRAASIWDAARNNGLTQGRACAYERLVLASVSVEEAAAIVRVADKVPRYTPIGVVACSLVLQRLKSHLANMFIGSVVPQHLDTDTEKEENARRVTVDSARSLGGKIAQLGDAFEDVWNGGIPDLDDGEDADGLENEIRTLLLAIVLYRRIFPSAVLGASGDGVSIMLSPPPSPTLADHEGGGFELRKMMGRKVFDEEAIEEARDRVVDLLVALERRGRRC